MYSQPVNFVRSCPREYCEQHLFIQWRRNEFESGAQVQSKSGDTAPENFFLVVPLHFFGSKSTISRFGERFRDGQCSLVSLSFAVFLLTVPPCPCSHS